MEAKSLRDPKKGPAILFTSAPSTPTHARAFAPKRALMLTPYALGIIIFRRGIPSAVSRFLPGDFSARTPTTRSSSNNVVEYPLPERPVRHIHHAIPLREAPLRDEVLFYAPVEPPESQHCLRKKGRMRGTEESYPWPGEYGPARGVARRSPDRRLLPFYNAMSP